MKIMLDTGAIVPTRAHKKDAGLDLYAPRDYWVKAGESVIIDTGVHVELPSCTYGEVRSRSGMMFNSNIVGGDGTIDEGYIGAVKVKLFNLSKVTDYHIKKGERIAQLVIVPVVRPTLEVVDSLDDTDRGSTGFGDSGK